MSTKIIIAVLVAILAISSAVLIFAIVAEPASDSGMITGLSASPDAFNPDTGPSVIAYSLGAGRNASVRVSINSTDGTTIRTFGPGSHGAGNYSFVWDGLGNNGDTVPDGEYALRISAVPEWQLPGIPVIENAREITVIVDSTPPDIRILVPADGATYGPGSLVKAAWDIHDDSCVPAASGTVASGTYIDTATIGPKSFTVNATDSSGNYAETTVSYYVDFTRTAPDGYEAGTVTIQASAGPVTYDVEIADTGEKIDLGLMNRSSLAPDAGMLFIFEGDREHYFWMENTEIPLDMIYISSDMSVVGVHEDAVPYDEESITPPGPCMYVLEVNAGQCRQHGIRAGDTTRIGE